MALMKSSAAKDNDRQTFVWSVIHYERVRNSKEKRGVMFYCWILFIPLLAAIVKVVEEIMTVKNYLWGTED